jgi:hypothetical protein
VKCPGWLKRAILTKSRVLGGPYSGSPKKEPQLWVDGRLSLLEPS